jgi:glutathione synthase
MHAMAAFLHEHGKAVCKPLHGMGGRSIFVLEEGDKNRNVVFETLTDYGRHFAIVQRYLPEIVTGGDNRVILINGEPVPYALQRMPDAADHRGNLAAGATARSRPLNDRDRWLCSIIGPELKAAGMVFVGLDVIGDYVTEINVTSPTGIRELNKKHDVDIGGKLIKAIADILDTR